MIKVVLLIRSLGRGGTERNLVTLAQALQKEDLDITVFSFYPGEFDQEMRDKHIKFSCLDKTGRWDVATLWHLTCQLMAAKPHILYSFSAIPNLLVVFLKLFLPSTRIFWGVRRSCMDYVCGEWFSQLIFRCQRVLSSQTDYIIFNSHCGRGYYVAHGFPDYKAVVIHNGIDTARFNYDHEGRSRVRSEWGIPLSTILIGLVARLDPIKDHHNFLEAAALLSRERDDLRFVCVGSGVGVYARQLYQLSARLNIADKVIWAGKRTDMNAVYSALDIACCSSQSEGFPNALGEAMACTVPCVTTNVGDAAIIVGDAGIVVPPRNPTALATGLTACFERKRSELSVAARARIVEMFDISKQVEQMVKIVQHAVKRGA
jgi:glycosyltransferase involved in cell wall biosynthesis